MLAVLALFTACAVQADAGDRSDDDHVEGAIGLLLGYHPTYPGSSTFEVKPVPAGFLRWGRITVTGAGGFTTRRRDEVDRGLGAELVRRDRLRLSLNLRYDNGRAETDSPELAGMGDIRRTVRARAALRWDVDDDWRFGAGLSVDTLNRVGGYVVDASLSREWRLGHVTTGQLGFGLSAGSDRFMQAWYGVTPEQAARTGYPVFQVPEGLRLRDMSVSGTIRTDFTPRWSGFAQLTLSRALGPSADSPLVRHTGASIVTTGLVWRF